jgi:hypothetical protein
LTQTKQKELWTCPKCGHKFVTKNIWHSCGNHDFDHHFKGKEPLVYEIFLKYRAMVESLGQVACYSQKTRIVFQDRMRFGGCQTRKNYLQCALLLTKEYPDNDKIIKIEKFGNKSYGHYFKIEQLSDLDSDFMKLIEEAYQVGQQKYIKNKNGA